MTSWASAATPFLTRVVCCGRQSKMSSKDHKAKVSQLVSFVDCTAAAAETLLKRHAWNVEAAANDFYENGAPAGTGGKGTASSSSSSSSSSAASGAKSVEKEFARFEDKEEPGRITADGIEAFCGELGVDMYSDPVVLVLCYEMGCKEAGVITKEEWVKGFSSAHATSVAQMKAALPSLRAKLDSQPFIKGGFWSWVYSFNCDPGQKTIKLEAVIPLAQMLISSAKWALIGDFATFLGAQKKPVSKDAWNMLLQLMQVLTDGSKMAAYEASDAWPALFDDFTDYLKKVGKARK